jgi:hypothetical protein
MHRRAEAFSEIDRELTFNPVDQSNNAQMGYILYLDRQYDSKRPAVAVWTPV